MGNMSGFVGMDSAEVRRLAQTMGSEADELWTLVSQSSALLENLEWAGPDRDRMLDTWRSQHVSSLKTAAQRLQEASEQALRYAEAQERESRR